MSLPDKILVPSVNKDGWPGGGSRTCADVSTDAIAPTATKESIHARANFHTRAMFVVIVFLSCECSITPIRFAAPPAGQGCAFGT